MGNEVFFLPDDEPHLLFLEAGCPSVGVVGSDVPLNATVQSRPYHFNTTDSKDNAQYKVYFQNTYLVRISSFSWLQLEMLIS